MRPVALIICLCTLLTGRGEAMSLSVSICYQMGTNAKTMACLRQSFHEAVVAANVEEKNAVHRLGGTRR
jgi:hypothetical protein